MGRKRVLFLAFAASSLLTLLFLQASGFWNIPLLLGVGFTALSTGPLFLALVQDQLPNNRAVGNGLYLAISFMIRSLAMVIVGAAGDMWGLDTAFFWSTIISLLAIPMFFFLPKSVEGSRLMTALYTLSSTPLSQKKIFNTWWPLAMSWLLMALELPALSAVIARLEDPEIHLAAYGGVVFPIALIIEAPVIMLLAASTALSKDWASYSLLRNYMRHRKYHINWPAYRGCLHTALLYCCRRHPWRATRNCRTCPNRLKDHDPVDMGHCIPAI